MHLKLREVGASARIEAMPVPLVQAAAKELRSAQRRASECRVRVRGEAPASAAAAAAAAQVLRADDGRQGAAQSVRSQGGPW